MRFSAVTQASSALSVLPNAQAAICLAISTSTPAKPPSGPRKPYGGWSQRTPARSTPWERTVSGSGGSCCASAGPARLIARSKVGTTRRKSVMLRLLRGLRSRWHIRLRGPAGAFGRDLPRVRHEILRVIGGADERHKPWPAIVEGNRPEGDVGEEGAAVRASEHKLRGMPAQEGHQGTPLPLQPTAWNTPS